MMTLFVLVPRFRVMRLHRVILMARASKNKTQTVFRLKLIFQLRLVLGF